MQKVYNPFTRNVFSDLWFIIVNLKKHTQIELKNTESI